MQCSRISWRLKSRYSKSRVPVTWAPVRRIPRRPTPSSMSRWANRTRASPRSAAFSNSFSSRRSRASPLSVCSSSCLSHWFSSKAHLCFLVPPWSWWHERGKSGMDCAKREWMCNLFVASSDPWSGQGDEVLVVRVPRGPRHRRAAAGCAPARGHRPHPRRASPGRRPPRRSTGHPGSLRATPGRGCSSARRAAARWLTRRPGGRATAASSPRRRARRRLLHVVAGEEERAEHLAHLGLPELGRGRLHVLEDGAADVEILVLLGVVAELETVPGLTCPCRARPRRPASGAGLSSPHR